MARAAPARLRMLTLNSASRTAAAASSDTTNGTSIATAIPAGHRRLNHSAAHAAAPAPASMAKASAWGPGSMPVPRRPGLIIMNSRPPAWDSATQPASAATSRPAWPALSHTSSLGTCPGPPVPPIVPGCIDESSGPSPGYHHRKPTPGPPQVRRLDRAS